MTIEQCKALIAGTVVGLLIGLILGRRRWRLPSEEELEDFLWSLGMRGEELARTTAANNQALMWIRNWHRRNRVWQTYGRVATIVLASLLAWPLLASVAPPPSQSCREDNAAFVIRQQVSHDVLSNGRAISVPAGIAVAWSCVSREEAEAELQRQIAKIAGN